MVILNPLVLNKNFKKFICDSKKIKFKVINNTKKNLNSKKIFTNKNKIKLKNNIIAITMGL